MTEPSGHAADYATGPAADPSGLGVGARPVYGPRERSYGRPPTIYDPARPLPSAEGVPIPARDRHRRPDWPGPIPTRAQPNPLSGWNPESRTHTPSQSPDLDTGLPHSSPLRDSYASWTRRAGAYLIDCAPNLMCALLLTTAYVLFIVDVVSPPQQSLRPSAAALTLALVGIGLSVPSLLWTAVNRWLSAGRTGQSVGRRRMGIILVSEDTRAPIGPLNAMCRDVLHLIDAIGGVGFLWPLLEGRRRTYADMLMRSVVLRQTAG